jgi:hypothetical protein
LSSAVRGVENDGCLVTLLFEFFLEKAVRSIAVSYRLRWFGPDRAPALAKRWGDDENAGCGAVSVVWAYIFSEDDSVVAEAEDLLVKAVARVERLAEGEEKAVEVDCFWCFRPATAAACERRSLTDSFEDLLDV